MPPFPLRRLTCIVVLAATGCALPSTRTSTLASHYPPPPEATPPAPAAVVPVQAAVPAEATQAGLFQTRPAARRPLKVYVIDGADPLGVGGARGLADRLRADGYGDTRHVRWVRARAVEREIRAAHAADPSARFAIVGYSAGTFAARTTANRLTRDGVPVAVLGYVGGDYLSDGPATRPAGVGRVVNVMGRGHLLTGGDLLFNGSELSGARNLRVPAGHYQLTRHPDTVAALEAELAAAGVE